MKRWMRVLAMVTGFGVLLYGGVMTLAGTSAIALNEQSQWVVRVLPWLGAWMLLLGFSLITWTYKPILGTRLLRTWALLSACALVALLFWPASGMDASPSVRLAAIALLALLALRFSGLLRPYGSRASSEEQS